MIERLEIFERVILALGRNPVVGLVGPRQVGKTTLARQVLPHFKETHYFDLEDPDDLLRMEHPKLLLNPLRGLVVIDEVQRAPDLFAILRVLADRKDSPARFLVLGSASPELLRQSAESLAGRIEYIELSGLDLNEVGKGALEDLWERGGYPRSFLAATLEDSAAWRLGFIRTFLERDLAQLGFGFAAPEMQRFWKMLAHYHGQLLNSSEIGRNLGYSHNTIRTYVAALEGAFMLRLLQPWHENLGKRQVKSPKVYLRDSGILHALFGLNDLDSLRAHPRLGASWEGFVVEQILSSLQPGVDSYFWSSYSGAEIDLLLIYGSRRIGIEIKYGDAPRPSRSLTIARNDLRLDQTYIVHPGQAKIEFPNNVFVLSLADLLDELP